MGKRGQVFYEPSEVSMDVMIDAINDAGFQAKPLEESDANPTNVFAQEATAFKHQFLGSLPLSVCAVLTAKILPFFGPQPLRQLLAHEPIPGLTNRVVILFLLVTPVQFGFGTRSLMGPASPGPHMTLMPIIHGRAGVILVSQASPSS